MIGRIEYLFLPKSNIFFSEVENTFFKIKTDDGKEFLCSGYSFFIKSGFLVELSGDFNDKNIFNFYNLEVQLNDDKTKEELLEYVLGKSKLDKMIKKNLTFADILDKISAKPVDFLEEWKIRSVKVKSKVFNILLKLIRMDKLKSKINTDLTINEKSKLFKLPIKEINKCLLNPFLLQEKLNFPFNTCLRLFKTRPSDKLILNASIYDVLKENHIKGNTVMLKKDFLRNIFNLTSSSKIDKSKVFSYVDEEIKDKKIAVEKDFIMSNKTFKEVKFLHDKIFSLIKKDENISINDEMIKEIEEKKHVKLGEEQIEAVKNSATNCLSVITGGPGTGKTTILSCLLEILSSVYSEDEIALCSPTGKASIRMSESTGYPASTIHCLLRVIPNPLKEAEDFKFYYNEHHKLPYKLIVIDESSMIDQKLAVNLLKAIRDDVHIIFVGDINQLPPVGAGYFFRDLIALNVPCVKLIKTYRQSGDSTIIKLAKEIQAGDIKSYKPSVDFGFKKLTSIDEIIQIYLRGVKEKGIENIEILCPQNKGELGTVKLNNAIIDKMIPSSNNEIRLNGYVFRENARVLQTKNDYQLGVVNGQLGTIKKIDLIEKIVTIEFDGQEYEYSPEALKNIALGYCITIHKSQGSERKYVIEICSKEHRMNTKPLVYTGITRAKEKLIILGDMDTFFACPKKEAKEVLSYI